jgi:prevent-host-death family protein
MEWKLADAKNRFSEVVTRALTEGPQRVRRRNETVVVISEKEYGRLRGARPDFIEFLLNAPSVEGVDLTRDKTPLRDIEW